MAALRFAATIKIRGINPYLPVSAARAARLKPGWRRPLPVLVRVDGRPARPWRINMMPTGKGGFYLYLHGDVRKAAGAEVGDRVVAEVAFDAAYRGGPAHPLPAPFRAALARAPRARAAWDALIPSRKKEILRCFAGLKSAEARERNYARALRALSGTGAGRTGKNVRSGAPRASIE